MKNTFKIKQKKKKSRYCDCETGEEKGIYKLEESTENIGNSKKGGMI